MAHLLLITILRTRCKAACHWLILIACLLGWSPAAARELRLERASGYVVSATINDQPVRLRIDPGAPGYIVLNPDAARKIGLKGSLISSSVSIGPTKLEGETNQVSLVVDEMRSKARVVWVERNITDIADGIISPEVLPYERVTLQFSSSDLSHRRYALPMRYDASRGLHYAQAIGDENLFVRFSVEQPTSLATASAGALIAAAYRGQRAGAAVSEPVRFGITRPVRPMRLGEALLLQGFPVTLFGVRTSDNRGKLALPDDPNADPDEIVVTGQAKSKQPRLLLLTLGRDRLGGCSSTTYSKPERTLSLQCAAAPA